MGSFNLHFILLKPYCAETVCRSEIYRVYYTLRRVTQCRHEEISGQ